jgi:hypothetical protein
MFAGWLCTMLGHNLNPSNPPLVIIALAIGVVKIDSLPWQGARDKTGLTIDPADATTVMTEINNLAVHCLFFIHQLDLSLRVARIKNCSYQV